MNGAHKIKVSSMTKINITATYSASEQGTDADDKHDVEYR